MIKTTTSTTGVRSPRARRRFSTLGARGFVLGTLALATALCVSPSEARSAAQEDEAARAERSLEETRLTMGKWIETLQILSKERNDWQQAKEILVSRLDLVRQEVASLEQKIQDAETDVAEAQLERDELAAEGDELKSVGAQLTEAVGLMEVDVHKLIVLVPPPIQEKLQPLYRRMPTDGSGEQPSAPERFQNVLGILNELNKANNEITVSYEVHTLADGRPSEVQAIYVGLAQAYYVSAGGQAGIGRPTAEEWQWEPSEAISDEVVTALEILQGKHTPAFVPLPVKLQ